MSHVALLIPTLDRIGGAERQVLLLAQGLVKRGWQVTVIALSGTGKEQASTLRENSISFFSLHMRKGLADPRGWIALNRWLHSNRPSILHAHLPHATWMARWSRVFAPACVVVDTVHTAGTGTLGRKIGYLASNWLTNKITVVSHRAADAWRNAGIIPHHKLIVLPNGIDAQYWQPDSAARAAMRKRLGLHDEFLWLAAGRLEEVKDFPTLLRAFAGLPVHARLVIAGEGSQQIELESLAKSLSIADHVHMPGYVEEMILWMQAADAFVLSSRWEGLPMSLLEACACALPVVSTAVAGAAEILPPYRTNALADVGDFHSLQNAMLSVMQLPITAREHIGLESRQHIKENFSLTAVLDQWEDLYNELLQKQQAPA